MKLPFPFHAFVPGFRAALQPDGTLELLVYEAIGEDWFGEGLTAKTIKQQIDQAGPFSKISVRVNSPGGNAFEGIAIRSLLRAQNKPVDVIIDGIAASAASIVAMAGDTITMGSKSAMMMIHEASAFCGGNAGDMRQMADILEKVSGSIAEAYVNQTKKSVDEVKALMAAETWLSADDCVAQGFATSIEEEPAEEIGAAAIAMARKFKALRHLKNVPVTLKAAKDICDCSCSACAGDDCANCTNADCDDANCTDCPMQGTVGNSNLTQYQARLELLGKH